MRFFVYTAVVCLVGIITSCSRTSLGYLSGRKYSNHRTYVPAVHTQTPIPKQARTVYGERSNTLVPPRPLATPATTAPAPNCGAVCVIDPRTGNVLFGHNEHERRQVASTQKIVTALCACDAGELDRMMTITRQDKLSVTPIRSRLNVGESYTRGAIMHAMLTASCNDLAQALARDSAGSVEKFVARMNARAQRMRMYNTHFTNPSGLPGPQYSTAYDMALAACYAYSNPVIRDFIDDRQVVLTRPNGQQVNFNNTNKLLAKYSWVQGMKTGYTNAAKRCLISCGSANGRSVIVVVLGCEKRRIWAESEKYLRWALGV
ncbi:MAG: D-alanyl-D-alanine carboxypeptidase [Akkermansia sp.]|nr:D-alanyl-D-alanine carboxypeptidase [Akkermansia sp.]